MTKKITLALACAAALAASAAPAANAGETCDRANANLQKYGVTKIFETATIIVADEVAYVSRTACDITP